jgi:hypothetical protein
VTDEPQVFCEVFGMVGVGELGSLTIYCSSRVQGRDSVSGTGQLPETVVVY